MVPGSTWEAWRRSLAPAGDARQRRTTATAVDKAKLLRRIAKYYAYPAVDLSGRRSTRGVTHPSEEIDMAKTQSIPAGMTAVTPHLVVDGAAQAIEFYKKAFGATEEVRLPGGPNGKL